MHEKKTSQAKRLKKTAASVVAANIVQQQHNGHEKVEIVSQLLHEHFENFLVMGYDYNNEPVIVVYNKTPKDKDAMSTLLKKFLAIMHSNNIENNEPE